ncbi:MAG: SpoIIE family protein phosphatase, partial [Spirochaetes bacterium]|nr:SpoIIE family protein phosphatase [Spirochaetota bacterium]
SILKLDELLDRIMTSTIELVGAERGALYLYPEKEEGSVRVPELELKVVHDVKKSTNTDTFHVSKRILKNIEEEKKPLIISDAGGDKELKTSASVVRTGLKSVLCAPIMIKGEMLGVIYLDSRLVSGLFKEEDLQVLELLASQSAVSIQNARLYQKTIDLYKQLIQKERLEQDLQIAGEIQKYFLPRSIEGIEELKIDTHYKPAEFVGGDYYDIVKIRKKKYGIIIVDISGHGSSAAIVMSVISSIFHSVVDKVKDTAELISILSERLHERLEGEKYATGIFIIYDEQKDQFEFTNAGHNNILLYNRAKGKVEEIPGGHGVPIGVFENSKYKTGKFKMKKGDIILLQTDGVYETKNEKGKLLELERVREMLGRYSNMEPEGINKSILDEVDRFRGKGKQDDDITLITIKKVK